MLYPKINGVFKRDHATNQFIMGDWSQPEFEELSLVKWLPTEKVDGTNIRIYVDGDSITIKGRTEKAVLADPLVSHIHNLDITENGFADGLVLYGEGHGGKIQAGAGYSPTEQFILFDAMTPTRRWLTYAELTVLGDKLNIPVVPAYTDEYSLISWIDDFVRGLHPQSYLRAGLAEGIVLKPVSGYQDRYGKPIITKLKVKDFNENSGQSSRNIIYN